MNTATLSPDGIYRYTLSRRVQPESVYGAGRVLFLMLNPSTADETTNDPTVRRLIGFAKLWGFADLDVGNLYALRTPYPSALWGAREDPVGPDNNTHLLQLVTRADRIVCAWGAHAKQSRVAEVENILRLTSRTRSTFCFGMTKSGSPRHPLYIPYNEPLIPWSTA